MRRADALLFDMLDAARRIVEAVAGRDRRSFLADDVAVDAVLWRLAIIGEAAGRVPPEFQAAERAIPWRRIAAMRNRLVHGYFAIDHDRVWKVIAEDVPVLIAELERLLGATGQ
jgi:uncharacterized protein with HEPN domain